MRSKLFLIIMIFFITLIYPNGMTKVAAHAPEDQTILDNADDHCNNPTMEIVIAAVGPFSFDRDIINLPTDTCVTILFYNVVDFAHNFVIEPVEGDSGMDVVWMDLENSTAVCGQASSDHEDTPGQARFNILTPKFSAEIEFYCSYPGHYEAGMRGILKIGGGITEDSLNTTGFLLFSISVFSLLLLQRLNRKE